jgi:hypothetical protein
VIAPARLRIARVDFDRNQAEADLPTSPCLPSTTIDRERQSTHDMEGEDEEYDNAKEGSKCKLIINMVRLNRIP